MTPRTSRGLWFAVAAITTAVAGCSSDTRPTAPLVSSQSTAAALAVAATFNRMGDSVVAQHGDSDAANRYYGAAAVLRRVPVFDTITISIDSVPMTFNAVALDVTDSGSTDLCPMPPMANGADAQFLCPWGMPHSTRTLFAWQPGHPPHIVQLVATADSSAIGLPGLWRWIAAGADTTTTMDSTSTAGAGTGAIAAFRVPAQLEYFSGDGTGIWWGSNGTQMNSVTPNGNPCGTPSDSTASDSSSSANAGANANREGYGWGGLHISSVSCQMADFSFQFAATVRVPPINWWHHNTASGTHTVSLDPSHVPGAYVTIGIGTWIGGGTGH
ncbi:MAG: hypothetical protein ACRENQ_08730 [Gemmatimonadaceae bacterium]